MFPLEDPPNDGSGMGTLVDWFCSTAGTVAIDCGVAGLAELSKLARTVSVPGATRISLASAAGIRAVI